MYSKSQINTGNLDKLCKIVWRSDWFIPEQTLCKLSTFILIQSGYDDEWWLFRGHVVWMAVVSAEAWCSLYSLSRFSSPHRFFVRLILRIDCSSPLLIPFVHTCEGVAIPFGVSLQGASVGCCSCWLWRWRCGSRARQSPPAVRRRPIACNYSQWLMHS